ncbi:MAG TPA: hypothetical protein VHN79_11895 [Lacunisphaera sp.]|nr:hypothetical protein [Lacunisphaera sp.]
MPAGEPGRCGGSWLGAQGCLPLAFMGLALAWLAVGTGWLAVRADLLTLPHAHPHVVALVHVWVLGFFVTAACGAVYQLAPVALGTTLWSERHGWWHFGLHALGVPGMVWSFWRWDLAQLGHFGTAVALGIALYVQNVWRTVRASGRLGLVGASLRMSAGWLALAVVVGLVLAANRFWHFIPLDPLPLLRFHAHLGLAGFFATLLQGVTFQLVPMFTRGEVRDWRLATRSFWLSQAALVVLLGALLFPSPWAATGAGTILLAGYTGSAWAVRDTLRRRHKRALDPGLRAFLGGGIFLLVAGMSGVLLVWPGSAWGSAAGGHNAMVYGTLLLVGGLLPCFLGMLGKIVPFLTWMRAYGPHVGRRPTPAASTLGLPRWEAVGLGLPCASLPPLCVGTWTASGPWLSLGTSLLAAGVACFLTHQLWVLRHLWLARALPLPGPTP